MIAALTAHFDAVEKLQADLEARIREALADVSAEDIVNRADELPDEIAQELKDWIETNLLQALADESLKLLEAIDDPDNLSPPPNEDKVNKIIAVLLTHYLTLVQVQTAAAVQEIAAQIEMQTGLGRDEELVAEELDDETAGIGKRWAGFGNALVAVTDSFVNSAAGAVVLGSDGEYTWLTVHDGKVCIDCSKRQGESNTVEEWIKDGLPRTGWSVCGGRCRCILVPTTAYERAGSPGPVQRKRR